MMAGKKKIYYLSKYGQLGNQLSVLAHLLAFAIEFDYTVVHPESGSLYNSLRHDIKDRRLVFSKRLENRTFSYLIEKATKLLFVNKNIRLFDSLFLNQKFTVEKDFNRTKMPRLIAVNNWLFRYHEGVLKHQEIIRRQLSFDDNSFDNARSVLLTVKNNFPLHTLVGVHVRRGDYATWLNGKYYYDNAAYYQKLKEIAKQLDKCVFIICTNEDFHFENKDGFEIIYAKGGPAEDMFLLSQCKYITGPPSTFSSWAAFLGNQNLLFLHQKDDDVSLSRFEKFFL